jgi:ABC-type transport system involved in cytochrome c biogenesis permease subunit
MSAGTWNESKVRTDARAITPFAILRALGSLKITVTLFVLAILIVLIGTLAQDEQTMVEVKREYFKAWIAMVPLDVLVPQTLYPHQVRYDVTIPFPGGALIGLALLVNLMAAKTTRFSVQGDKLVPGIIVSLIGGALITAVIMSGHTFDGLQGKPPISYDQLWLAVKGGLGLLSIVIAAYAIWAKNLPKLAKAAVWTLFAIFASLTVMLLASKEMRLDDPGLRIVWQLLQATVSSCVLLAGFLMLFGKRGGNMLIHVGIALLMVGQFGFGDRQIEQKINLVEGEQASVAFIPDALEIAIIDKSQDATDDVRVIPDSAIRKAIRNDGVITDVNSDLPCLVRIDKWMPNSKLQDGQSQELKATVGTGLAMKAVEIPSVGGASSEVNLASVYITLLNRETKQPIDSLLLSQQLNDGAQMFQGAKDRYEKLSIGGKPYEFALRFRKEYKPYEVTLIDVQKKDYANSNTPRDYSSIIKIRNPNTGEEITEKTWMNNPVRFSGETFYQSNFFPIVRPDGSMSEGSGLQVVRNEGWVIPYVCCMMVMVGMFSHFGGTFVRFAGKFSREQVKAEKGTGAPISKQLGYFAIGLVIAACFYGYGLRSKTYNTIVDAKWEELGTLPTKHEGRIKPAESLAANLIQVIGEPVFGGAAYIKDAEGNKRSNIEWMFGVMANVPWTGDARVFRIYSKEVRDLLDLEERTDYRYSHNEINKKREKFFEEVDKLRKKPGAELNFREQKISEMYQKLTTYELLSASYEEPPMPLGETDADFRDAMIKLDRLDQRYKAITQMNPPAFLPPSKLEAKDADSNDIVWRAYAPAKFNAILQFARARAENPAISDIDELFPEVAAMDNLLEAIGKQDGREIQNEARKYRMLVSASPEISERLGRIEAETWLNRINPTMIGIVLYILAFIAGLAAFATPRTQGLRHVATGMILGVFIIHTATLVVRMYIQNRAPVVNLYSSAVFIGWACVLLCILFELVLRSNVGKMRGFSVANIVGSVIGIVTLCIARSLDKSDTMHVLAAVLDTQFWLSTHVVTVTLGYAVTYLAGFLGAVALIIMMVKRESGSGLENSDTYRDIYRLAYFSICFGILFSFVGTVLGGLWADDSWGRFWGWDPKENGALMIVLWNALVLHARWDRMVGLRGFCLLALIGNIVTSWSWFGTNLLGIGLHNYGFNKSVAVALVVTLVVHAALIGSALLLTSGKSRVSSE